jgi:hypothetical protein
MPRGLIDQLQLLAGQREIEVSIRHLAGERHRVPKEQPCRRVLLEIVQHVR